MCCSNNVIVVVVVIVVVAVVVNYNYKNFTTIAKSINARPTPTKLTTAATGSAKSYI